MANLIKMDLRRLFRSPMFLITLSVAAVFNILLTVGMAMLTKMFASAQAVTPTILSDVVSNPFVLPIFSILIMLFPPSVGQGSPPGVGSSGS